MQHPQALRIFSQRKVMVEPVFSHLRCQQNLNRFRRRGLQSVKCECALHTMAHNLSRAVALLGARFVFPCFCALSHYIKQIRGHFGRVSAYRGVNVKFSAKIESRLAPDYGLC